MGILQIQSPRNETDKQKVFEGSSMRIRTKQIALFSILGIFLLASYQNCAADGFIALQVEDTDLSSLNPPGPGGTGW